MTSQLETTFEAIFKHAERRPDHAALVAGDRTISYGELKELIAAVAGGLGPLGARMGERIGVETNDPIEHFAASVAIMLYGGVSVAIPNDSAESYEAVLDDARPRLVVTNGVRRFDVGKRANSVCVEELVDAGAGRPAALRQPEPEDIAMIYYTSGTSSGVRKGVLQSYRALSTTAQYISEVMKLDDSIVEYVASPVDNAFWFGRCRVVVGNGGTALLSTGSLNPFNVLSALHRYGGNAIAGDTPIFVLFLHHMSTRLRTVGPQIRWAKVASQTMSIDDKLALQGHLPNARIIMNYGLTEAMRCCLLPFSDHPDKLASVGRPSPGVSVRVVSDGRKVLPPGETGEIEVSGENVASGYLNKEELWRSRFRDGWYATADLGYIDSDGFVFVLGRNDEAINVGGRKVAPNEVEEQLRKLIPGRRLGVFAIPDPARVLGNVVAVAIEGAEKPDFVWPEFRIRLFEMMPSSNVPREAFLTPELPMTSNGKVRRRMLSDLASSGQLTKL
jgi:acyl-CoA synthetase (AMP-forming)/AMP-acid ligase II